MIGKLRYYNTYRTDPFTNLAVEEYLLRHVPEGECVLYLWQNKNTVVIGRNQNALRECRVSCLEADGGVLARRLSGGGAVYHDLGNLNFTFLACEADFDVPRQMTVITDALRALGIEAELTGRNDVTVEGRKISGNAYYRSNGGCYHHGTLLVDADMGKMGRYLNVPADKLARHGVASVRSRVANLREFSKDITCDMLRGRLIESFARTYGHSPEEIREGEFDADTISARAAFFASDEWRFGAGFKAREISLAGREPCPAGEGISQYDETDTARKTVMMKQFDWGSAELAWVSRNGRMRDVRLYSDGLEADFVASLPALLEGAGLDMDEIASRLKDAGAVNSAQEQVLNDLQELIRGGILDGTRI